MTEARIITDRAPACGECRGKGFIKVWPPRDAGAASMARCEQCSGLLQFMRYPRAGK